MDTAQPRFAYGKRPAKDIERARRFGPVQAAWFKASEGNLRRQAVIAAH